MAEGNGSNGRRGFVGDRERFTAAERRDLNQLDERAEHARKKVADCEAALKRFEAQLGAAFLEKKDPPRAAVDLQRQLTEARRTVDACAAVRPDKVRALEAREKEWLEKRAPEIGKQNEEWISRVAAAVRAMDEVYAGYQEHERDVGTAAPGLIPPQLPNLRAKLDHIFHTLVAWPPKPAPTAADLGLIRVRRLSGERIKRLDPLHRLYNAAGEAYVQLNIDLYGPGEVFSIPARLTVHRGDRGFEEYGIEELLGPLGLERVPDEQPHETGVTP